MVIKIPIINFHGPISFNDEYAKQEVSFRSATLEILSHCLFSSSTTKKVSFELVVRIDGARHTLKIQNVSNTTLNEAASHLTSSICSIIGTDYNKHVEDYLTKELWKYFCSNGNDIAREARKLPGVEKYVNAPCKCNPLNLSVFNIIIHLNDKCGWSRERIADWIDELHDRGEINAEFDPWEEDKVDSKNNVATSDNCKDAGPMKYHNYIAYAQFSISKGGKVFKNTDFS